MCLRNKAAPPSPRATRCSALLLQQHTNPPAQTHLLMQGAQLLLQCLRPVGCTGGLGCCSLGLLQGLLHLHPNRLCDEVV